MNAKSHPFIFIIAVLLLSWIIQVLVFTGTIPSVFGNVYMYFPAFLAIIFFLYVDKDPLKTQIELFTRRLKFKAFFFAIFYPFLLFGTIALIGYYFGFIKFNIPYLEKLARPPTEQDYINNAFYTAKVMAFLPTVLGEEYAWRGYLLPKLARKYGLIWASVIVGIVWGAWHIPSYYITYSHLNIGNPVMLVFLGFMAVAVSTFAYSYCFYLTGGNILPVVLLHAVYDATALHIFFGMPEVAGLAAGSPGILLIKWPIALVMFSVVGLLFVPFFIWRLRKIGKTISVT